MSSVGFDLAEAHVMRKQHKEKMKREKEEKGKGSGNDLKEKKSHSIFSTVIKKIHPSGKFSSKATKADET
ncbi:hypothetical protein ACHQM5_018713 [Ranunculus cassubicifolius]